MVLALGRAQTRVRTSGLAGSEMVHKSRSGDGTILREQDALSVKALARRVRQVGDTSDCIRMRMGAGAVGAPRLKTRSACWTDPLGLRHREQEVRELEPESERACA